MTPPFFVAQFLSSLNTQESKGLRSSPHTMASTSALAALAAFETRVDGDAVLLSPGRWHERERPRLPVPPPCELPPPGLWATGREFLYESRERFERRHDRGRGRGRARGGGRGRGGRDGKRDTRLREATQRDREASEQFASGYARGHGEGHSCALSGAAERDRGLFPWEFAQERSMGEGCDFENGYAAGALDGLDHGTRRHEAWRKGHWEGARLRYTWADGTWDWRTVWRYERENPLAALRGGRDHGEHYGGGDGVTRHAGEFLARVPNDEPLLQDAPTPAWPWAPEVLHTQLGRAALKEAYAARKLTSNTYTPAEKRGWLS